MRVSIPLHLSSRSFNTLTSFHVLSPTHPSLTIHHVNFGKEKKCSRMYVFGYCHKCGLEFSIPHFLSYNKQLPGRFGQGFQTWEMIFLRFLWWYSSQTWTKNMSTILRVRYEGDVCDSSVTDTVRNRLRHRTFEKWFTLRRPWSSGTDLYHILLITLYRHFDLSPWHT